MCQLMGVNFTYGPTESNGPITPKSDDSKFDSFILFLGTCSGFAHFLACGWLENLQKILYSDMYPTYHSPCRIDVPVKQLGFRFLKGYFSLNKELPAKKRNLEKRKMESEAKEVHIWINPNDPLQSSRKGWSKFSKSIRRKLTVTFHHWRLDDISFSFRTTASFQLCFGLFVSGVWYPFPHAPPLVTPLIL